MRKPAEARIDFENLFKVPVPVVCPPRDAKATGVPKGSITPEIRKQIEQSLAPIPLSEKLEATRGNAEVTKRSYAPAPRRGSKQPRYLKSLTYQVIPTPSDPDAPNGRDSKTGDPIRVMRTDTEIAAALLEKPYLAPGDCPHRRNPEYCLLCGNTNYRAKDIPAPRELGIIEEALLLAGMKKKPVVRIDEFDYFPEILGITRRQLVGLFDLPCGTEPHYVENKVLKSSEPVQAKIVEIEQLVPKQIEKRKKLIAASEERIRKFSDYNQKIQVRRGAEGDRDSGNILDKPTRERFKREERKRISRCRKIITELRDRPSHLDALRERLKTWGSRPEDHETVFTTEHDPVTFRERLELIKDWTDKIKSYFVMLTEYGILRDESRRLRSFPAVDKLRYFENDIIFQAVRCGLLQPTAEAIKKYPELRLEYDHDGDMDEHYDGGMEDLIIKTGGAEIGASIFGAGTNWNGSKRGLSSFDGPVAGREFNGSSGTDGFRETPGDFYGMDSGDFGSED